MTWRKVLLALVVSLLVPLGSLRADVVWGDLTQHCVTGTMTACLWTQVTTERVGDQTHAKIYVRNIDNAVGYGYRIAGLGLTAPELFDVSDASITAVGGATEAGDAEAEWTKELTGTGSETLYFGTATQGSEGGIQGCHDPNNTTEPYFETCVDGANEGWVVFSFTTSNDWTADEASIAYKIMSINDSENGTDESLSCPNGDLSCTTTTVPEPISMILMGTGLAGLGAVRHRRRKEEEDGEFGE